MCHGTSVISEDHGRELVLPQSEKGEEKHIRRAPWERKNSDMLGHTKDRSKETMC